MEAVIPEKPIVYISNARRDSVNGENLLPSLTQDSSCKNLALLRKPVVALALLIQERHYDT